MSQKLEIRAFFFNAKTDYLPYYKNFSIVVEDDATAKDLLAMIEEKNENFSYPKQKLLMKINGLVVEAKQSVSSLVERFGTYFQIDPVNSYRSNDGLKINDSDFMQSFEILAPYASEDDLTYYKTLYALHYASETEKFDRDYIGDAILVLGHKMIKEGSEHAEEILQALTSAHSGLFDCEYENNLFNAEDHTDAINELKAMAKPPQAPCFIEKLAARFGMKKDEAAKTSPSNKSVTIKNIEDKQIAYYAGARSKEKESISQLIKEIGAHEISFSRSTKLSGLGILEDNRKLALKKAGATLLDAFDSGAEVLVVEEQDILDMFRENFSEIQKVMGREILGLELISVEDFKAQVSAAAA
jgi:hypothetical protein